MSSGEELLEPPEERSEATTDPVDVLTGFKDNGQKLKNTIDIATVAPTQEVMAEIYGAVNEAGGIITLLYDTDFFKGSENDMLVSMAISAYAENLRAALICAKKLNPSAPGKVVVPVEIYGESGPLRLEITADDGPNPEAEEAKKSKVIDIFADFMIEADDIGADKISKALRSVSQQTYDSLLNGLGIHPVTKEFLQKEARRKKLKDNAFKIGMVAGSAFVGTAAAEALFKYL